MVSDADAIARCDIVVNATAIGMGSADMPCDPRLLHRQQVVADIVYHPRRTAWLNAAAAVGARTVEGLGMLVHQALMQQQLWTGTMPDVAVLWQAAERELAAVGH
jgi:shikimate dehydrogenase